MNRKTYASAASITPDQITAIKMGQKHLGISDEDYRATLWERYHVDSCRDLNREQATDLIEDYVSRGFILVPSAAKANKWANRKKQQLPRPYKPAGVDKRMRPSHKGPDNVAYLVTAEEIDKINKVSALIAWREANGLALFLTKRMGINEGRVKTSAEAYLAIEGLKKMFENQMKARHGEAWWTMKFGNVAIMDYIAIHKPAEWR